jgi:hypothetical protein
MNPMKLNLFNKMAACNDNSLDSGRVPLECLCHGVTSLISCIRSSVLLLGFALALNSETPQTK